jgi:transposase-like protein
VEGGTTAEVCRHVGIAEQTFYTWKRKYPGMGLSELRELRLAPWVQTLACFVVTMPFSRKDMVIAFSSR